MIMLMKEGSSVARRETMHQAIIQRIVVSKRRSVMFAQDVML